MQECTGIWLTNGFGGKDGCGSHNSKKQQVGWKSNGRQIWCNIVK